MTDVTVTLTYADKATAAWGDAMPDWVAVLAERADTLGMATVATLTDYGASSLSTVITNKYGASTGRVEQAIRGAFMGLVVACPVQGQIGRAQCIADQRKPFDSSNHLRVKLFRSCRNGCPHFHATGGDNA